jgi:2-succinyl-6-hydroxy-2,4-cyclohexadiene-1-carboxylate synthase
MLDTEHLAVEVPEEADFTSTAAAIGEIGGPATYVGYSMGGRLVLQLALDRPGLVERMILVSASPGIGDRAARRRRYLHDMALAEWIEEHGRERFLERWLSQPVFAGLDPIQARRHRLPTAQAIASQLRRLGQGVQIPLWDRLHEIDVPTLMIAGERDPKYVTIVAEMLADIGMSAEVEIVPNCSHAVGIEWPGAVASLINEFTADHPGTSTA